MSTIQYSADHGFAPVVEPVQTSEPNSEKAFSAYSAHIEREFIEGSSIAPLLYAAAITVTSDVDVLPGGEVAYPIHEALNWKVTRFGHQARPNTFAALLKNADGSTWQAKLNDPKMDRKKNKPRKYETPVGNGSRAYFPPLDSDTIDKIALRYGISNITSDPWDHIQRHPEIQILLTEGAKKALSLLSQGYVAIALYGVNGGYRTKDDLGNTIPPQLISDLIPFCTPGRQITLAFDQDEQQHTRNKVTRAINKFGGLLQDQECSVTVATWNRRDGKGVDDLIVNQGVKAWESALEMAMPLNLWRIAERLENKLTYPAQLQLNSPDLSQLQLEALPETGIIGISSSKGSGKTKCIANQIKEADRLILGTHRIALARHLCHRLGMDYRGDLDKVNGEFFKDGAYALKIGLCVDSLLSISPKQFEGCDLILDEVVQVIRHLLTSSTCNQDGKRPALLAKLRQILQAAKRIIVADADLDDATLDYLIALRGKDETCFLIRNDYQPVGYKTLFLDTPDRSVICQRLLQNLTQLPKGKALYVATDSKSASKMLVRMIYVNNPDQRVLLINSETSGGEAELEFMNYPDQVLERNEYDVIVCSPSMATGTSIERNGAIERVYGVFMGVSCTDADMAQALIRVREPVERVVWCARVGRNYCKVSRSTNPLSLKGHLFERTTVTTSLIRSSLREDTLMQLNQLNWQDDPHIRLYAQISAEQNLSMMNLRDALQVRLQLEGNQVYVEHIEADGTIKEMLKQASEAVKRATAEAILKADDLNYAEVLVLEQQESLAPERHIEIQKYYLCDFYCLDADELTLEYVLMDREGRWRGEVLNLEAQLNPEVAHNRTVKQLEKQASWRQHLCPWDIPGTEMRREIRERLGLTVFIRKAADGGEWTAADLERIANTAREFAPAIKAHLNFSITEQVSDVQVVHQLLSQMGIKVQFRWSNHTDDFPGKKVRVYSLNMDHWQLCQGVLERRQMRRVEVVQEGSPSGLIDISSVGDPPVTTPEPREFVDSASLVCLDEGPSQNVLPLWGDYGAQTG